jgi:ABC-type sugar transport system ATPase subunit
LLLAQPTQGVDVGAKADIRTALRSLAAAGTCVIVASAESDEIAGLADRAYVMNEDLIREVPRSDDFETDLLQTLLDLVPEKGKVTA